MKGLELSEWATESELKENVQEPVVWLGLDAEAPRRYYSFSCRAGGRVVSIAVRSSWHGTDPKAMRFESAETAIIGHDTQLSLVDLVTGTRVIARPLLGVFFEFLEPEADEVIAVHELGALRIRHDGHVAWDIRAGDVVEDFRLDEHGRLILRVWDSSTPLVVDSQSGLIRQVSRS